MIRLNTNEVETRLQSIQTLLDVRNAHPSVEPRKIMDMIGEILFPKEDIDTGQGNVIPNATPVVIPSRSNGRPKSFNNRVDLIGDVGTQNTHGLAKYLKNPWHIPVGTYQKCERCNKVGIISLTLDTHPSDKHPVTRLYKRYTHDDNETHSLAVHRVEGTHTYENVVKEWEKTH